jgi:superfamily I DNA/RNA helicase
MWLVPIQNLTVDQLDAVNKSTVQHRVFVGGPGSGKTLVLLHRARKFVDDGLPQSHIRVIVYTKVLRRYLQSAIESLGFEDDTVTNLDKLIVEIHKKLIGPSLPKNADKSIDWDLMRKNTLDKYKSENRAPMYDAILVDEGQDISRDALELLKLASEHLTIAMDSRQDVFGTGMGIKDVCDVLEVPRESAQLLTAYRCTPFIVNIASAFLPEEMQEDFRNSNLMSMDGIRKPEITYFTEAKDEYDTLFNRLVSESTQGNSTAVLFPTSRLQYRYAKAMKDKGLEVAVLSGKKELEHDYMGLTPMFLTYHSAKGLTVDSVLLPALSEDSFKLDHLTSPASRNRLLFVAITRAVKWLWLGVPKQNEVAELSVLTEKSERPFSSNYAVFDADPKESTSRQSTTGAPREGISGPPSVSKKNKINVSDLL